MFIFTDRLAARAGYAWEQAEQANKHGEKRQYNREKAVFSQESMENDTEKTKSYKKVKTVSEPGKSAKNKFWEKTKKVGENVIDGIAKSVELTLGSVTTSVKPSERADDFSDDNGGADDDNDGSNDGVGVDQISITPENVGTKTWNDIKNRADGVLEASIEYPDVLLDTNKVGDSGCTCHVGLLEKGKPKPNLYDTWDCSILEHSKKFPGVENIPEVVERDEGIPVISGESFVGTNSNNDIVLATNLKDIKKLGGAENEATKKLHSGFEN